MEKRLTARQRLKVRKATRQREPDPSEAGGELNIVPFLDVVVNLMLFLLATTAATAAIAQTTAELPATCSGRCRGPREGLDLSVTVVESGIVVAARGGRLAPGCEGITSDPGVTVPRTADGHDFAALRACLERVHARFEDEDEVILSAGPSVTYEELIAAMDAARGSADAPLFPDVRMSAGVR